MIVFVAESGLRRLLLRDGVLHSRQTCLQLLVRWFFECACGFRRCCPLRRRALFTHLCDERGRNVAVAVRILHEVFLMIVLGAVEVHNRFCLNRNRLSNALLQGVKRAADHGGIDTLTAVCIRYVVDARAILTSDVVALPILRRRVDGVIEGKEQLIEADLCGIVDDMHRLRMAAAAAYLAIGRMRGRAVRIAALRRDDAVHEARIQLRPPEAAACEVDFLLPIRRHILLHDLMRHLRRGDCR